MLSEFLRELQRRRVVRVAVVYAVAALVAIVIAATVFPDLQLPAWTSRLVVVLALLGFPIAMALAWAFDITPAGVQRTHAAPESPAEAASTYTRIGLPGRPQFTGGRARLLALATAALVVAVVVAWLALSRDATPEAVLHDAIQRAVDR
jgi:hypothetical protein